MREVQCYSLRRVNPFRGLAAVVKTESARAISLDGKHWQVQVLAHAPRGLWANTEYEESLQYFRFGIWNAADGLTRVPLNPMLDLGRMLAGSNRLTQVLPEATRELPFPLAQELELWLLDQDQQPLALLATAMGGAELSRYGADPWIAGGRGERPFVSPTLADRGLPESDSAGRFRHAEALEQLVRRAAGRSLNRQWFRRDNEYEALGLTEVSSSGLAGRRLPGDAFPELLLRDRWPAENDQSLVEDYFAWLSPFLLMLPGLSDKTRQGLERKAQAHALLVEATWRLYPKVLDPHLLNQTRVEAKLRRAVDSAA